MKNNEKIRQSLEAWGQDWVTNQVKEIEELDCLPTFSLGARQRVSSSNSLGNSKMKGISEQGLDRLWKRLGERCQKHSAEGTAGHGCLLGPRRKLLTGHTLVCSWKNFQSVVGGNKGKCAYTEHTGEKYQMMPPAHPPGFYTGRCSLGCLYS